MVRRFSRRTAVPRQHVRRACLAHYGPVELETQELLTRYHSRADRGRIEHTPSWRSAQLAVPLRPAGRGEPMCDQDHFEEDRQEYEARGLVTRRQFGVLLGAGVAMMLPRVANAVDGDRIGGHREDAGRHGRLLLRASRRPARRPACSCGRTSSGCGRRSARWASGSPSRAIRCSWSIRSTARRRRRRRTTARRRRSSS